MASPGSGSALHVACGADAYYVRHLAVMLHSLCTHARTLPVHVHVMDGGLPQEAREYLSRVVAGHGQDLEFVPIDVKRLTHLRLTTWFTPANYYRLLLPELLPQLPRVLYLDADIVVADDPAPLWTVDLGEFEIGAVPNVLHPENPQDHVRNLGLASPADYLNSGVLLMDLERMRQRDLTRQLLDFAQAHPQLMLYADQDALNGVLRGRWRHLHCRWNVQTHMLEVEPAMQPVDQVELAEALARPAIVHYIGWWKPWRLWSRHPLRGLYRKYFRELPRPVFELPKSFGTVLEYYFPGWTLLAYLRWRPRLAAVKRRIRAALNSSRPTDG